MLCNSCMLQSYLCAGVSARVIKYISALVDVGLFWTLSLTHYSVLHSVIRCSYLTQTQSSAKLRHLV